MGDCGGVESRAISFFSVTMYYCTYGKFFLINLCKFNFKFSVGPTSLKWDGSSISIQSQQK